MPAALRSGEIDLAVALCPEVVGELAYEPLRSEPVVALLSDERELARDDAIALEALADDECLIFPRELAPRLYDVLVNLCRSAGFEPRHGNESFHTRWTLGTWQGDEVALVPQSVARELPAGVAAVRISDPPDPLDTQLVWRADDRRAALGTFLDVARAERYEIDLTQH